MNLSKQKGFSLFMVMIIMLIIALLVVVTSQSAFTELRISTNDADRKYALSLAENSLRDAETTIQGFSATVSTTAASGVSTGATGYTQVKGAKFTYDCLDGNCAPAEAIYREKNTPPSTNYEFPDPASRPSNLQEAWKREINGKPIFDNANATYHSRADSADVQKEDSSRYIIEYLGEREEKKSGMMGRYFRVTARAKGRNANTVVMLQSYVEITSTQ